MRPSADNEKFWSKYARTYDRMWNCWLNDALSAHIIATLKAQGNCKTVLEIGCGTGLVSAQLDSAGFQITGIESNQAMYDRCKQRCPSLELYCVDYLSSTSATNKGYDALIAVNVLQACHELENIVVCILQAVSRDNATAVLVWPKEELSSFGLLASDIKHHRGLRDSLLAYILRLQTGVRCHVLRGATNSDRHILRSLKQAATELDVVIQHQALLKTHHFVVLTARSNEIPRSIKAQIAEKKDWELS